MNGNICNLILNGTKIGSLNSLTSNSTNVTQQAVCDNIYLGTLNYVINFKLNQGFKSVSVRYFDLLKYIAVQYYSNSELNVLNQAEFTELSN